MIRDKMIRDKLAVPLGCRKIMYIRHCTFDRSIIRVFSSSVKRSAGHVYDISVIRCKDEKKSLVDGKFEI